MPAHDEQQDSRAASPGTSRLFKRRNRIRIMIAFAAAVLVAVVLIGVLQSRNRSSGPATVAAPANDSLLQAVTGIPQSTLDSVGTGGINSPLRAIPSSGLTASGKPEVLYIGAEFCPFCAAERWAVIVALSRFGTFQGLSTTRSAPDDVYPNTPTFSFYGSTYTSQYLSFSGVELRSNVRSGNGYAPLQTATSGQQAILEKYDGPPYTSDKGAIPFLDVGGKYVHTGASYSPGLFSGMDWQQIASKLADPTSKQAKAVLGAANLLTAAFCELTGGQPQDVCQAPGTKAGGAALAAGA